MSDSFILPTVCVIEQDALALSAGNGFWLAIVPNLFHRGFHPLDPPSHDFLNP